jgi:hypothetical protein
MDTKQRITKRLAEIEEELRRIIRLIKMTSFAAEGETLHERLAADDAPVRIFGDSDRRGSDALADGAVPHRLLAAGRANLTPKAASLEQNNHRDEGNRRNHKRPKK